MLQAHANDIRSRLRLTASALVIATAGLGVSAADAQTVTVASGGTYDLTAAPATTFVVPTGVVGELHYDNSAAVLAGSADLTAPWNATLTAKSNASPITVQTGATLHIYNPYYWAQLTDLINAQVGSTVIVENHSDMNFFGANYFYGDLYLHYDQAEAWSPPVVDLGQSWNIATNYFGTSSRILMDGGTTINFNEPHAVSNTIDKFISYGAATVNFNNGTMIVNGVNTAAAPFTGTVYIGPGATFMVGDASHPTAVFGDPTASAAVIGVDQGGGVVGILKGYGKIYGSVLNASEVAPGGTLGTAGTLAIVGDYAQLSVGEFVAEVTPTGVSKMTVSGTASLAGTLLLKIDDGNYTTPGLYDILTAKTLTGSFNTINLQGNAAFVGTVKTATGYQVAVESQNSAQTFAHVATASRFQADQFARALFDRADDTAAAPNKLVGWLAPYGNVENISRSGLGFDNSTYGVRGGVEYHLGVQNAVIGLAASYGSSSLDSKGESSSADINTYGAAVYGGADLLYARIDGSLYVNRDDASITRSIGSIGSVSSSPTGVTYGASVKISKDLFGGLVTPFASGYYARVHLDEATETGNDAFALSFRSFDRNYMATDLGLKVHAVREPTLKVDISLAIEHDFSDRGEKASAGFANITGSSANYLWKGDAENALIAGVYVADQVNDKVDLFARINGEFSLYKRAADFSAGVKYHF